MTIIEIGDSEYFLVQIASLIIFRLTSQSYLSKSTHTSDKSKSCPVTLRNFSGVAPLVATSATAL